MTLGPSAEPESAWPGLAVQPGIYVPPRSSPAPSAATSPHPTSCRIPPVALLQWALCRSNRIVNPTLEEAAGDHLDTPSSAINPAWKRLRGYSPHLTQTLPAPSPGLCSSYYTMRSSIRADGCHHGPHSGDPWSRGREGHMDTA